MGNFYDGILKETQKEAAEKIIRSGNAVVDPAGRAVIPVGTEEIGSRAFDGRKNLRYAAIPASVKKLGLRCFADCWNLHTLKLQEGLETVESNVFTECRSLKELVIPDSVKELDGWAFYGFYGLQSPVYNVSGSILYCYPVSGKEKTFRVPGGIKRIHDGAFLYNEALEEIILPEGLERIDTRAFLNLKIRRITIPASVQQIEERAFWSCEELEEVVVRCDPTALAPGAFCRCPRVRLTMPKKLRFDEELRLYGYSLLGVPRKLQIPMGSFWKDKRFLTLAKACAGGDTGAMMEFADHFDGLGNQEFFKCAANFWRFRASRYGNEAAKAWVERWMEEHPRRLIPSVMGYDLNCIMKGDKLRALGFLFFDPEREYSLHGKDEFGVVLVSSWSETEGPDEDGFGMEELYDWWHLDEYLNEIPGVQMIHSYSSRERQVWAERFDAQHEAAVRALQSKRQMN